MNEKNGIEVIDKLDQSSYKLVAIAWEDSHSHSSWQYYDDIDMELCTPLTVGILVHEDDEKVIVTSSSTRLACNDSNQFMGPLTIPKSCITSMTYFQPLPLAKQSVWKKFSEVEECQNTPLNNSSQLNILKTELIHIRVKQISDTYTEADQLKDFKKLVDLWVPKQEENS